ncbi:hypothetical protein AVEN_82230-1, partial [Araneus ventricosus]
IIVHIEIRGRSGLVVRPRARRVQGSKPDSTEDPPSLGACYMLNNTWWWGEKHPPTGVLRKIEEGDSSLGAVLVMRFVPK